MSRFSVLFVDDEPNILNSLKRVFFSYKDFTVFTANSAQEGANILSTNHIDVVVSDEKMPKVKGHQFIQYVRKNYPDISRCILTGYADSESIIRAVNLGEVYRYLVKPWKDEELVTVIRHAAEHSIMKRENNELKEKLQNQNSILQKEVLRRTEYLEKALNTAKYAKIEQSKMLNGLVSLLSDITSHFNPEIGEYSTRVSHLAEIIASQMEMDEQQISRLRIAALLHGIGVTASGKEPSGVDDNSYVKNAERMLDNVPPLKQIKSIIRYHIQNFDGTGYPGDLQGEEIPLEARILKAACDFDRLRYREDKTSDEVMEVLVRGVHIKYDPYVIQVLRRIEMGGDIGRTVGLEIPIKDLAPGMVLRDDLLLNSGTLCIPGNTIITKSMREHLTNFMNQLNPDDTVVIRAARKFEKGK